MNDEEQLRKALAGIKQQKWAITSKDRHSRREVRDQDNRGIIWCGVCVDLEAHSTAEYVAAANPEVVGQLLAELDFLRTTQPAPGAPDLAQAQQGTGSGS